MFIGSISLLVIAFVIHLSVGQTQSDANLPSLCCITGDGRNYLINTTFITADCKLKCVCTHDAYLGCVPLCPNTIRKCPAGFTPQKVREAFRNKNQVCLCAKYKCVSAQGSSNTNYCSEGNKVYKPGEVFVRNCNQRCRCQGGQVQCVSLCPNVKPCMIDHTEKDVLVPLSYSKCQCTAKACKPFPYQDKCLVNGHTYKTGDYFVSADCSSNCTCHPGGKVFCVNLCPAQGNPCTLNQQVVLVPQKVPNTNCTCSAAKCVKNNPNQISVVGHIVNSTTQVSPNQPVVPQCTSSNGKIYPVGAVFSDNNCSSQCHCLNGGVISCQPLCFVSLPDSSCTKHKTVQMPTGLPDAQGKNCSCPFVTCI